MKNGDSLTAPEQAKSGSATEGLRRQSSHWESAIGEGGRLDIIDYFCPKCHLNIYYQLWAATYCPHCNTPIFSAPRRKLDAEQFRNWHGQEIEGMRYVGPSRTTGSKAKRKADHQHSSGKTAKNMR